ncbi:unnamed protein product, partial [Rotaria sp. Silwood1]
CNNLSAIDLKMFLISVQQQLNEIFIADMVPLINDIKIVQTVLKLRDRLEILNVSFPFEESNISIR